MKISIPQPCFEKLNDDNYCSKCQHQITDFSKQELNVADLMNQEFKCGIFDVRQLSQPKNYSKIYHVILVSTLGLISSLTNAQETPNTYDLNNQSVQLKTVEFTVKLNSKLDQLKGETFRLIINDQLIVDHVNLDQEYQIKFDIEKGSTLFIKINSNNGYYVASHHYSANKLPSIVNFEINEMPPRKNMMLGKYIIHPDKNENR